MINKFTSDKRTYSRNPTIVGTFLDCRGVVEVVILIFKCKVIVFDISYIIIDNVMSDYDA